MWEIDNNPLDERHEATNDLLILNNMVAGTYIVKVSVSSPMNSIVLSDYTTLYV